jgi:ubiquinone/menaquinone biosynthesis C-methylase UbiE
MFKKKGNYDPVAPFYDWLSHLVYGNAIINAHKYLVQFIPADSKILIVGGGTGHILEYISQRHNHTLQITYVDISKKMIDEAKTKHFGTNSVIFVNQSILDAKFADTFDVVITPFLFDNFYPQTAATVFNKMDAKLRSQGLWLYADFQIREKDRLWKKLMLQTMYFFFRTLCNVEANSLPDMQALFNANRYNLLSEKLFYKRFICSRIYQKP